MFDHRLWRNFDWLLTGTTLLLVAFGSILISTASGAERGAAGLPYGTLQWVWALAGFVGVLIVILIDYSQLQRWQNAIYGFNLLMLASVQIFGEVERGAVRGIDIGPVQLQPSEFSKILLILTLGAVLARKKGEMKKWTDLLLPALHVLPPFLLVLIQPDLGTSLVYLAITVGMLYMGGVPGWRLAFLCSLAIGSAVGWVALHLQKGIWIPLEPYQLKRLIVFLDPNHDPLDAGYNLIQSLIAIGSGRLYGQGLYQGTQNQLNYLPEQRTDFIFAVLGEELGFIGSTALLLLMLFLLWRGLQIASVSKDRYGALIATGFVSALAFHILVNVGMTIGIMPITGIPLPFISYGGSGLITNLIGIGFLLSITMRRKKIMF